MSNGKFYTYIHRRGDTGGVFYVGKGQGLRAYNAVSSGRNPHWHHVTKKHSRTVEIVAYWDTEEEAYTHEISLIESYRKLGASLVNLTTGGDGRRGGITSPEQRAKLSVASLARWADPASRELILAAQKTSKRAPGYSQAMSQASKKGWDMPGAREAASQMSTLNQSTPEVRLRHSTRTLALMQDPVHVAKLSAGIKKSWSDPASRLIRLAAITNATTTPEYKAAQGVKSSQLWVDPNFREAHMAAMSAYRATPKGILQMAALGRLSGANATPVRCNETGLCYPSATAAGRGLHISRNSISKNCQGLIPTAGGFTFTFTNLKQTKKEKL